MDDMTSSLCTGWDVYARLRTTPDRSDGVQVP
jgi:hypothetical protein